MFQCSCEETGGIKISLREATTLQLILLSSTLVAVIIVATGMGYIKVPAAAVIKIIFAKFSGQVDFLKDMDSIFPVVVVDVRLPRILSSAIVGGGLAISGVVFQGILLNPLADPYTLGVSAGAAFGASLAILLNIGLLGMYSVPLFAFAGAVGTLLFVVYLSSSSGGFSSNNLILSGIIVAAILSAGISLLKYIADEQVSVIIFWLMGSFGSKNLDRCEPNFAICRHRVCNFYLFCTGYEPDVAGRSNGIVIGSGYPQSDPGTAGKRLSGSSHMRVCIWNHRICRAAGTAYDEIDHRARQPALGSGITSGGSYSAAGRRHHNPGCVADRNTDWCPDGPDRRSVFLLSVSQAAAHQQNYLATVM